MKTLKQIRKEIRKKIYFFWGRSWKVRSALIPSKILSEAEKELEKHQESMFFMLGNGRSGTQLISTLLNSIPNCKVFHEPDFREDVGTMESLRKNPEEAIEYWKKFRCRRIHKRWKSKPGYKYYGEVNGTIRYQARAIQHLFPRSVIFHLVRDGRDYVRSVMGMPEFYNDGSKGAFALEPLPGDPYYDAWNGMSRFEKVCWSWREANQNLSEIVPPHRVIKLERIAKDYEYTKNIFNRELGILIPLQTWQETTNRKSSNSSRKYDFQSWRDWPRSQLDTFNEICGDMMEKLGYTLAKD